MKKIQEKYLISFDEKIQVLRQGIKNKDQIVLRSMGHKLHGSGASYGFQKITEYGKTINELAHKKKFKEIEKQVNELDEYINNEKQKRGIH